MEMKVVNIRIDGKPYEAHEGKSLLDTALSLGLYIPHFCYHPALGSVGACRLCAVKKFRDTNDTRGRIVMSCMEPVVDGLIVSINDPDAKAFRAAVIESLMTNHPHDCPVCDEGGECHLQDMTVMSGHNYRRFDFRKRTHNDQYLGPFISHEMNRCIQCYRCVRFYRDYAGGRDFNVFATHNNVFFGRHEDGTLQNEFSGNLVEVCPTGVFTDKTFREHYTRKWDLSNAPSVCVHCSVGCNIIAGERYDTLRRIMNRYNGAVNGYFICDRGRFGYEFVNGKDRILSPRTRDSRDLEQAEMPADQVFTALEPLFSKDRKIMGIGSPRASLESNYALLRLVGEENFFHGISGKEQSLTRAALQFMQNSGIVVPSLKQVEKADAVIILGEDLTNTAPMMALAVRQAARNIQITEALAKGIPFWNDLPVRELAQDRKSPVYIATPVKDSLDDVAERSFRGTPAGISKLGFNISSVIKRQAIVPGDNDDEIRNLAEQIARTLLKAENPLVIAGITCLDGNVLNAGMSIASSLLSLNKKVMFIPVLPESNSMGLALMPGKSLDDAADTLSVQGTDTLIILENDLFRRADEDTVANMFGKSGRVVVLDYLNNPTARAADILLPATAFAESQGTIVNNEGRAQRYYKVLAAGEGIKESWQWLNQVSGIRSDNVPVSPGHFDDIVASMVTALPVFSAIKEYIPDADFRMLNAKVPRQTFRYSGRTAMNAHRAVSEKRVRQDPDSPLAFSMEGRRESPPSSLVPFYWTPGWNSVQAFYNYIDHPNGSMKGGDPGIRLIRQAERVNSGSFEMITGYFESEGDGWLIVPLYRVFGSEELSSAASSLRQLVDDPAILVNRRDAERLNVDDGDSVRLETSGKRLVVKVKIENSLVSGVAGLTVNLPGMNFVDLPASGEILKI
ncbi:MAG TPA: NADH-quinone oxidoreductase subunit NuoG [Bacteroidales bacterium]|nr:NADH-quinone oxidoreductase subunit NuoG [Bacteroidales bacterium]HPM17558.1 NADH-quinone oxidoreductase subunit NuoG [Bacteroidales bacterium]HPV16802.1 NADH-quinone oxidoreductase subunit NuoG [Bacteroidales bacterium]